MKARFVVALAALLALPLAGRAARAELPDSDPRAVAIADSVMAALGGGDAWGKLVGLRWTFEVSINDTLRPGARRHAWNKRTGWHRIDYTNRADQKVTLIHNLNDQSGLAWVDGTKIEGDSLAKLMKRANSVWINDTYWMLMPYKLRDPGVRLKDAGDSTAAGTTWDRLALSFENVGDTPGDHYWVYVNRASHRVEHWEMVLQGDQPPPRAYSWEGWEEHGGLWFPTAHRQEKAAILTDKVETVDRFGDAEFTAP